MTLSFGLGSFGGHQGSAPSPFDALDGPALVGPDGSHPLREVRPDDLVRSTDGAVEGEILLDRPARVGEGITGTIRLRAHDRVAGRSATLRLVGLRLDEVRRSRDDHDSEGRVTHTERWVEAQGRLFVDHAFLEPRLPADLEPGATWEGRYAVPAPPLGPPSAHLGESIIAWALEVRWDVPLGADHFVACYLPIAQHPDLLGAGVGRQGGLGMLETVPLGDASIRVASPLPCPAGSELVVAVSWPSAPGGDRGRIELHRLTNAPNGVEGIVASVDISPVALADGPVEARLPVPAGLPPSFDGAGLEVAYVIRVLVDRRFRSDAAIERPVSMV